MTVAALQPGVAARLAAWEAVRLVHDGGAWSAPAVDRALRRQELPARDRALAANLAFETLRWEGTLDWALSQVVTRPLSAVEGAVLDVLRVGAWQLLYGRMPARAAVSATVEMARAATGGPRGNPRTVGFVNGVLRGLDRARARLPWPSPDDDRGLGLETGYPEWIVAAARERFGPGARAVLEAGNAPPGLTLRIVGAPGERDSVVAELRDQGFAAEPGAFAPEAVRVPGADPGRLAVMREGRATPQDEASMLVVRALAGGDDRRVQGARILDACAAPGGKTTHLAQLGAHVVANDLNPTRAGLVAGAAERLGLADQVEVTTGDATRPGFPPSSFDAVLVDAPCTGLGVVRRRPDLRWRRDAAAVEELAALQLRLLEATEGLVRPGGRLVYSACTWTVAETAEVANVFLAAYADRWVVADDGLGGAGERLPGDPGRQLGPGQLDGMYVIVFDRR